MTARAVAIARITAAARGFPEIRLRAAETADAAALDARDAALAAAIEHQVLRRWLTLKAVIESQLSRPWDQTETRLQAALLCGAAQLLLMDRLPEYAVINEAVEWTKTHVRPKAGGVVNAVLRKLAALRVEHADRRAALPGAQDEIPLHDGRVLRLASPVFADDPLIRLAQQTSTPMELLEHWINSFGVDVSTALAVHSLVHAPIVVHGLDRDIAARLGLQPHDEAGFFVVGSPETLPDVLREQPGTIVQDPTAASAVEATKQVEPAPRLIVDVCAGRGTKTRQLARMYPNSEIVATDIDDDRLRSLHDTFAGHQGVRVVKQASLIEFVGKADLIVLDVPCSNSGVLARRVEAKYRFSSRSLRSLVDLQRQIVADSLRLASEKGWLMYTTCSIEPLENQHQAAWLTQWHPYQVTSQESRMPVGAPGDDPAHYRDGGYWALLCRR